MIFLKRILINGKSKTVCDNIASALLEFDADITSVFEDKEALSENLDAFDVIIISTPLRTEFGLNYAAWARKKTNACILMITKADIADDVQKRLKFTGAYVLPRPFSKASLIQSIKMGLLAKDNISRLEEEKNKLSKQLDDVKTIDRAKCCLIEYLNMTENQAHRHIQKLAMDTRRTQRDIAEDVLKTYSGITNV